MVKFNVNDKVVPIYNAVISLLAEGKDLSSIKVIDISNRAYIGKGTIYEYFDTKEEVILSSVMYDMSVKLEEIKTIVLEQSSFENMIYAIENWVDGSDSFRNVFTQIMKMYLGDIKVTDEIKAKIEREKELSEKEYQPLILGKILLEQAKKENIVSGDNTEEMSIICMFSQLILYVLYTEKTIYVDSDTCKCVRKMTYNNIVKLL